MAMGIVSDAEIQKEKASGSIKDLPKPGRKTGDENIPEAIRKAIADVHIESGRSEALQVADLFGVSSSSVSAYASGRASTSDNRESNKPLSDSNAGTREKIVGKAQSALTMAIAQITEAKLSNLDAVECSQVAKNMAGIVKDFTPDLQERQDLTAQIVIFAPPLIDESRFAVIQAHGE